MDNKYFFVIVSVVAVISISLILTLAPTSQVQSPKIQSSNLQTNIITTNGIKHIVPLDEIKDGGPPKDGIPSIDNPKFIHVSEAKFLKDDDLVIGIQLDGQTKAYPLLILVWHEIVNDKVGTTPVAVTYCPLCFTTQVFDRRINGTEVEFGTSGKLYNSNLVMYDRYTNSYWSQALGEGITGDLTSYKLEKIPSDLMRWSDWKSLYPNSNVLSTDTGFERSYGADPYGDYYTDPQIIFPVSNEDSRMGPKEMIIGYEDSDKYKAYKIKDIASSKLIDDIVGKKDIMLISFYPFDVKGFDRKISNQTLDFSYADGKILDKQTNSEWNFDGVAVSGPLTGTHLQRLTLNPGFWFEWVAFHPQTEIYLS
ncbi:MAG: DUF3179 domain-containing protein [Candidatus Nitrosotalea sp.]|nr:DUF3179 domain-containing protein [Candidatus Nitrosotalea sp.]